MTIGEIETDVLIVGAGPAGLMMGAVLARFGVSAMIVDERNEPTEAGRADGIQPKTLETFDQLGLLNKIESLGVKIFDITFWNSIDENTLKRTGREDHFPKFIDLRRPYILLFHQGIIEKVLIDDIKLRNGDIKRNVQFLNYKINSFGVIESELVDRLSSQKLKVKSKYLIGCDGAHSAVRKSMPDTYPIAQTTDLRWGVIDGELDTDFPDFWSKTVVRSASNKTVLGIPRERNLTRLYIELEPDFKTETMEEAQLEVQSIAQNVLSPFKLRWNSVEWFSVYRVRQGVTNKFQDNQQVFIVGDASHTHSANAAQGMNVSMHDSWNLGWKIALVLKYPKLFGTGKLLPTFEMERQKVANDLINFDKVHTTAFKIGDPVELAKNFEQNVKFISGIGAEYSLNVLNTEGTKKLVPGTLPLHCDVLRCVDSNEVAIESAIPILGQFNIYFIIKDLADGALNKVEEQLAGRKFAELYSKASETTMSSEFELEVINKKRYLPVSSLFSLSVITKSAQDSFEINELPKFINQYKWGVFIDNKNMVFDKWVEDCDFTVLIQRPDGYIGAATEVSSSEFNVSDWLYNYFGQFTN